MLIMSTSVVYYYMRNNIIMYIFVSSYVLKFSPIYTRVTSFVFVTCIWPLPRNMLLSCNTVFVLSSVPLPSPSFAMCAPIMAAVQKWLTSPDVYHTDESNIPFKHSFVYV